MNNLWKKKKVPLEKLCLVDEWNQTYDDVKKTKIDSVDEVIDKTKQSPMNEDRYLWKSYAS